MSEMQTLGGHISSSLTARRCPQALEALSHCGAWELKVLGT